MDVAAYRDEFADFLGTLLEFESLSGDEKPAQRWLAGELESLGFDSVIEWYPDESVVLEHLALVDQPDSVGCDERPVIAGVMEFGDPNAGPTLVFNGHIDVVPADAAEWSSDPFTAHWDGDLLTARGSVDMKSGLAAGVYAAVLARQSEADLNGRIVVESVPGEEDGGVGAIASAYTDPYPFDRDGVVVMESTDLELHAASEGSVRHRLELFGKRAHPGRTWEGESVLPHFCRIYQAFCDLERERAETVTHPYYDHLDNPWPMNVANVRSMPETESVVPDYLRADLRIGVAPTETKDEVSAQFRERLEAMVAEDPWLREHPPTFDRISFQLIPGAVEPGDPVITSLCSALDSHSLDDSVRGYTGGADTRFFNDAGIPAVLFGPASADTDHGAHTVNETVRWSTVEQTAEVLATMATEYLSD